MQRRIALNIIYKTISDSSYTNLLTRSELEKLEPIKRPFVTDLVNGVLQNYDYLEYQHKDLYKKTSFKNKLILSMALYERFFLKKEAYVTNNEYVNLASNEFDKSFINAILRKIDSLKQTNEEHIKYSLPKWIYSLIDKQYSKEEKELILHNYQRIPKIYYHINSKKCNKDDLKAFDIEFINDKIFVSEKNLLNTDEFKNGYFYVQDINAASLIDLFEFEENDTFLDACSAPGSKLFNALEYIKEENAYSNDINEKRVNLIKKKARILGYDKINYSCFDASKLSDSLKQKFNKILLDVPCSGLGVIGRRKDIKFHIKPESLDELQIIQKNILEDVAKLLKDNGELIYSTCTINKKENTKQVQAFLSSHQEFKLIKERTILNLDGDLFYEALLKKV